MRDAAECCVAVYQDYRPARDPVAHVVYTSGCVEAGAKPWRPYRRRMRDDPRPLPDKAFPGPFDGRCVLGLPTGDAAMWAPFVHGAWGRRCTSIGLAYHQVRAINIRIVAG